MYVAADGQIRHILDAETGVAWASSSMRTPIFYDSDNTGYYVDPASTSNLNDITVPGNTWGSQSSWSGQTHSAYECPDGEYICGIDIDYYCYNCVDRLRLKCCSL